MNEKTQRDYMIIAIEAHIQCYLESKTGDKVRSMAEAKELAHGLSLSLRTTEAILRAEKTLGTPIDIDTIDVGDEDHIHVEVIPSHTNPNTKKMKVSAEPF